MYRMITKGKQKKNMRDEESVILDTFNGKLELPFFFIFDPLILTLTHMLQ